MEWVFVSIGIIFFSYISITLHELGHLILGLSTGYSFISFRIGSFVWYKSNDKIMFNLSKDIVIGQCLLAPPKKESDFKYFWYNMGGVLFNFISLIMLIIILILPFGDTIIALVIPGIFINIVFIILNGFPMKNIIVPNDVANVIEASQSQEAKHGMYMMIHVENETMVGNRYRDFGKQLFQLSENADTNNYFIAYMVMLEAYRLYDLGFYDESVVQYERLDIDKLPPIYKNEIRAQLIYYYTVHNPNYKTASEIYNKKHMKQVLNKSGFGFTKILAAYEHFVLGNKENGNELIIKAKTEIEKMHNKGFRLMEEEYTTLLENLMLQS